MDWPQFAWPVIGASLGAVLLIALLTRWLGFDGSHGDDALLPDDPSDLADRLLYGFAASDMIRSQDGRAALLKGTGLKETGLKQSGSDYALLRIQGAQPMARRFSCPPRWHETGESVIIESDEAMGPTRLILDAAARDKLLTWV